MDDLIFQSSEKNNKELQSLGTQMDMLLQAITKTTDGKDLGIELVKGKPGEPGKEAVVDYDKIIKATVKQIPKPIPGKPGDDADEVDYDKIARFITKEVKKIKIPVPKHGKDGKNAIVDYKNIVIDYKKIIKGVVEEIPDVVIETPKELKKKIEKIGIDYESLENLPDIDEWMSQLGRRVASKTYDIEDIPGLQDALDNAGGGSSKFIDLTDTPSAYVSNAMKALRVNVGETDLEFYTPTDANDAAIWGNVTGTLSAQTDLQSELDGKADSLGVDDNYVTDAEKIVIGNTSGTNTGDQDISNFETTTELNARDTDNRARANHTGTQAASTISDFDTEVANNTAVTANTAKVTNATHTGQVTGSGALTVDVTAISDQTLVTAVATDMLLIEDATDGALKRVDASDFLAGAGTVTSVAVSGNDGIEVDSGSPITSAGTIELGLNKVSTLAFLNVEDGADVTDSTNVTAAGALMDSELASIADVKALNQSVVTTASPQFAGVNVGHATDTTISRSAAGVIAVEGVRILTTTPVTLAAASYTTDTGTSLNMDNLDNFVVTAQAGALLFNAPGGTLVQGRKLTVRIKDNGTARALTWNAIYRAMGVALPSTTVESKTLYLGFIYNSTDTKWDLVASAQEA